MPNVLVEEQYLSDIANAVRMKGAPNISYTIGAMPSAISAINLSGSIPLTSIALHSYFGSIYCTATTVRGYAFVSCSNITSISFPYCEVIGYSAFWYCDKLSNISLPNCQSTGYGAFGYCKSLTEVNLPECVTLEQETFSYCSNLTTVTLSKCTSVMRAAFTGCSNLMSISLPLCECVSTAAFVNCTSLTTVSLPKCTSIGTSAFKGCFTLISLYLNSISTVTSLNTDAFFSTPIGGYSASAGRYGNVYVPASLYSSFIVATNWTSIADRIISI